MMTAIQICRHADNRIRNALRNRSRRELPAWIPASATQRQEIDAMMTDPCSHADALKREATSRCELRVVPGSRLKVAILRSVRASSTSRAAPPTARVRREFRYGDGERRDHRRSALQQARVAAATAASDRSAQGPRRARHLRSCRPTGVLSDRECREKKVGGEVLCTVE